MEENGKEEIKGIIKIRIKRDEVFWGNGMMELLKHVNKYHSLKKACETMGMSYTKGYKIIKIAEKELGFRLLYSERGGIDGGYSALTEKAELFADCYQKLVDFMEEQGETAFEQYFGSFL